MNNYKRIYISADYAKEDGDRTVVDKLNSWAQSNSRIVNFVDMAQVISGSVANKIDCRPCQLKAEFNRQINASSIVVFIVGDKTAYRTAGSSCGRTISPYYAFCTPYKQNTNGTKLCNNTGVNYYWNSNDVNEINSYSYLRHEFEQAKAKNKEIVIFYNSTRKELSWLPSYMKGYENNAFPFWINSVYGKIANYEMVKRVLGYA